eukprot:COSAG05_NODE_9631_length_611_cov_0.476562_1_plen_27_part_10
MTTKYGRIYDDYYIQKLQQITGNFQGT